MVEQVHNGTLSVLFGTVQQEQFENKAVQHVKQNHEYTSVVSLTCHVALQAVVTCICVFVQVWEGLDVVKTARKMLGETNPADSLPGTIRGDYGVEVGR